MKGKQIPSAGLYFAAFTALLGALSSGFVFGYAMTALVSMRDPDKHNIFVVQNSLEYSMIASMIVAGAFLGSLTSGPISNRFGRKLALFFGNLPFTVGWLMMYFSTAPWMIIVGRFLTGIAAGVMSGAIGIYLTEICTPKIRGFFGIGFGFTVAIGITISTTIGAMSNWRNLALYSSIPSLIMPFLMFFVNETPVYLASKYGHSVRTMKALRSFRAQDDVNEELNLIVEQANKKMSSLLRWKQIKQTNVYRPLLISLGLFSFQQLTGITAIGSYQGDIIKSSGFKVIVGDGVNLVYMIATIPSLLLSIAGSLIIDKFGRKALFYTSGAGIIVSLSVLGIYCFHKKFDENFGQTYSWLALTCIMAFQGFAAIGFNTVPWLVTPEITPNFARGFVQTISVSYNWALGFIVSQTFPDLNALLGDYGTFAFHSACAAVGIAFVYIYVPETKGKTYDEIQEIFHKTKTSSVSSTINLDP